MGTKANPGKFDCYSHAADDEPMFILLGRDPCAHLLVHLWAMIRVEMGEDPEKVEEARVIARAMLDYASRLGKNVKLASAATILRDKLTRKVPISESP